MEVEYYERPNIWIGPHRETLIKLGAMFSLCTRTEKSVRLKMAKCGLLTTDDFGCCELTGIGAGNKYFRPHHSDIVI